MSVLVYFRHGPWHGAVRPMPDERPTWALPHLPMNGVFYFGCSTGPLPQPAIYTRAYPHEWERVLTRDLVVAQGTRLDDFALEWANAIVFDCVSEGGR